MALDTVQQYIDRTRVLLLDQVQPYRYPDVDIVEALNMAVMEARRLRPDLLSGYFRTSLPEFSTLDLAEVVPMDPMYRVAFVYYLAGHCHLRDEENTTDSRAGAFLNKFTSQLLAIQS